MSCGMLMWFFCFVVGEVSGAKSPEELFLSPEGSKMVVVTLQKSTSLQKGKRTFVCLITFLFEISAWLENQLTEQLIRGIKEICQKIYPPAASGGLFARYYEI